MLPSGKSKKEMTAISQSTLCLCLLNGNLVDLGSDWCTAFK
jgi:hypothetical protein